MTSATPAVDAASLVAVPGSSPGTALRTDAASAAERICERALGGEALLTHVLESEYGRLGVILIPVVDIDLFKDKQQTVAAALKGVELAAEHGAKCVSFTGMIPAATDYVRDIAAAVRRRGAENPTLNGLQLTSGHASVVAAFAFNIDSLLDFASRSYQDERVAFVGLGSIGEGIARLMAARPAPRHIYLVDVTEKRGALEQLKSDLTREYDLPAARIDIVTVDPQQSLPDHLYPEISLILSATSGPEVIDVDALAPGTLIVDDSFPLGYNARKAVERMDRVGDIMITIAGAFQSPARFAPKFPPASVEDAGLDELRRIMSRMSNPWPDCLTGCLYSAYLTPHYELPETIGPVQVEDASCFYETLRRHDFTGTRPYFFTFGFERRDPIYSLGSPRPLAAPDPGNARALSE
ncbi:MAG: hypothetical protein QF578_09065 [Alphaproteobacteria bacterium]|jgi:hypothetical protein|nr:hypothetical protein [Alphaproteobacteria bacterium]MDP6811815.1 hypothetical protein [Alphaproteobacteria bacterium]